MKLKTFVFNQLQVNTYLLTDETTGNTIVIDPGCSNPKEKEFFAQYVAENGLNIKKVLNTHLHFDHIYGNRFIQERFGAGAFGAKEDRTFINHFTDLLTMFGMPDDEEALPLEGYLTGGDIIKEGEIELEVRAVPGHSPGGLAFYEPKEKWVFVGDCILEGGIGRTDMHKGNFTTLLESIKTQLLSLPDETIVYSGHGRPSTIGDEKKHNPFLRDII